MKALNQKQILTGSSFIKTLFTLFMIFFVMGNIGCSDKKRRTAVSGPRSGPSAGDPVKQAEIRTTVEEGGVTSLGTCEFSGAMPGYIYRTDGDDRSFEQDFYQFLSALGNPDAVENGLGFGELSSRCNSDTGVRFVGYADVNQNVTNFNNGVQSIEYAELLMGIYDSTYLETKEPIMIYATYEWGVIEGNYARIIFEWGERDESGGLIRSEIYGSIALEGNIMLDSGGRHVYYGNVYIKNRRDFEGLKPTEGRIGQFAIPACEFFDICN